MLRSGKRKGFSLMELVLVIGIIVVIVGGIGVNLFSSRQAAKEAVAAEEIGRIYDSVWKAIALGDLQLADIPAEATPIKDVSAVVDVLAMGGSAARLGDLTDPWGNPYVISRGDLDGD